MTRTFRISEAAFEALSEDARNQNVSLNTLVNQLLITYLDYDRFMKKAHMVKVAGPTLKLLMDAGPVEAIKAAGGETGRGIPALFILSQYGAVSLETLLAYFRNASEHGGLFEYNEVSHGSEKTLTFIHFLGMKGSYFISSAASALFEAAGIKVESKLSENAVVLSFHATVP